MSLMGKCLSKSLSKSDKTVWKNSMIHLDCSSTSSCTCDKCICCLNYPPKANKEITKSEEVRHITGVWKVHPGDCQRCRHIFDKTKIDDKRYGDYDKIAGVLWIARVVDMKRMDWMVRKHLGRKEKTNPPVTMKVELYDTSIPVIVETVSHSKEFEGFEEMKIDVDNDILTIRGLMDMKKIAEVLQDRLGTNVGIVPSNGVDEAAL